MTDYEWKLGLGSEPLALERHKFDSGVNQALSSLQGHAMEELIICSDVTSYRC